MVSLLKREAENTKFKQFYRLSTPILVYSPARKQEGMKKKGRPWFFQKRPLLLTNYTKRWARSLWNSPQEHRPAFRQRQPATRIPTGFPSPAAALSPPGWAKGSARGLEPHRCQGGGVPACHVAGAVGAALSRAQVGTGGAQGIGSGEVKSSLPPRAARAVRSIWAVKAWS